MDDGLDFSRSQEEESRTARVIRKCSSLFTKFIKYCLNSNAFDISTDSIFAVDWKLCKWTNANLCSSRVSIWAKWSCAWRTWSIILPSPMRKWVRKINPPQNHFIKIPPKSQSTRKSKTNCALCATGRICSKRKASWTWSWKQSTKSTSSRLKVFSLPWPGTKPAKIGTRFPATCTSYSVTILTDFSAFF